MKKFLFTFAVTLSLLGPVAFAHAQSSADLSVTPAVIDEKVEQRDIVNENITVKNNSNHVLQLYPSVNDINDQTGEQGYQLAEDSTGLSASLSNWIEISRGMVSVSPGEEKSIPFIIRVSPNAVANTYHAQITFTQGSTRAEADAGPALGTVLVDVEVKADIKELLELDKFSTGNMYFSGDSVLFNYQLQNIGNQQLQPTGKILIYNRNGQEVADVNVNQDQKTISPNQMSQLASVWTAANGFGRYKALLTVNYGASQTATVQDTVFFWVVPWKEILVMFIISIVTILILALYFHNWLEKRHLYKFAYAGLLNDDTMKRIEEPELAVVHTPLFDHTAMQAPRRVKEAKVKKRRFGVFKRRQKPVTDRESIYIEQQKQSRAEEQRKPEHKSLKQVLNREERPSTQGHSIDLKQLRMHKEAAVQDSYAAKTATLANKAEVNGHVISLKKKL